MEPCKICSSDTSILFTKTVLNKYSVIYYYCNSCHFVQTENPYWLNEAYKDAIADMDTGILVRNRKQQLIMPWLIRLHFNKKANFVDYGAGYGIFVRLMRDKGFAFYWQDAYAMNLFAKQFVAELPTTISTKYELLTAFEVFEHLPNPLDEIDKMLQYSDSIIFTTSLLPGKKMEQLKTTFIKWWYWSPETGQHVSFYSEKALKQIARQKGLHLFSNGHNFHLLTKSKKTFWFFNLMRIPYFFKKQRI